MSELDPRKQSILRAVVFEYVSSAEPVGSELLTQKYELGVKSATVRNELADLSELGFLEQPHTSAGRIPSDKGYRYFVDRLIIARDPESETKQRVRSASEDGEALSNMLRETTRALSRLTHLLTAATVIRDTNITVRNAIISALSPQQSLLVVILSNGHVENRMLEVPPGLTLQDLGRANEIVSGLSVGKGLRWFTKNKAPSVPDNQALEKLLNTVWSALRGISKDLTRGTLTTEGEEFLFGQPEFQRDVSALSEIIEAFKDEDLLLDALNSPDQQQTVTIGRENKRQHLHQFSIVRQSFYVGETEAGTIALIGPTRMRYESSIPLVNYAAKALSDSLTKFFG
ncbi:MAG TPA: heat-inducible transcriptional repressor HrcA [Fimbriimonadaceae bacterium]|jgi:heat-inducible transcriptional repressor